MDIKYEPLMKELWELAGEIGAKAEDDERYAIVYKYLAAALDCAESKELITYEEEV